MQTWEYKHLSVGAHYLQETLDTMGLSGWELVTILNNHGWNGVCDSTSFRLFFKKEII